MAQAPRPAPGDSSGRVAASPWEPAVTASLSPAAFAPPSGNPLPSGAGPSSAPAPRRWSSRRASQRRAHGAGGAAAAAVAAGGVDAGGSGPARLRGSGRWRVAAARARGAGGPGGGTALRGGASGRPQLLRVRAARFRALCSRERLLASFGDSVVRLSTANTYSYRKVDLPFQEYVEHLLHPQDPTSLGNNTLYFFGDNNFSEWASLFQHYSPPPFSLLGTTTAYSFGIAGAGSGVPFHWHGPGFSEVIYGRKRWFLYPPEKTPEFHPNKTTLTWLQDTYPTLAPSVRPLECTVQAGEVLYFPDRWWHATLNLDTSVFISTFLG
ncbi:jmjC domain-containing protein 8 isoform X2 [Ursus arctos]|uniref:jmjC domain-containing protein 8 isoform X2 n=1 Tax=Ursus arctos TaxID=9644 RepID=UPI0020183267|nr:jmjC domain-containing protein 8 isoform X2 [Ursus arctos]